MLQKSLSTNRNFLIGSILTGLIISIFAIAPQIDLWMNCENKCHGIYAINDLDEPFYAAYLVSLIEGKPRRNSPYTGAVDSEATPQKESGLSIQVLASYPLVFLAKTFNLSISNLMIIISLLIGFFSAFIIYWLVFLFTKDDISSFVGTLVILFLGNMAGGQGATFSLISSDGIHFLHSLVFLRRYVPATGFPALFLFIIFVWKFFNDETPKARIKSAIFAFGSFTFCVYSYYYFWTTAFAWFFSLIILLGVFRFEKLKENLFYLLGFGFSLVLVLIPYFILVSNRETNVDSVILMNSTRAPDLWEIPEIISYFITVLIFILVKLRRIDLKDMQVIFLLSLNLVTIIVFNQQIITGRSIQPYHYQIFCVNYLVTLSLFLLIFISLKQLLNFDRLRLLILVMVSLPICVGLFDTIYGNSLVSSKNLQRGQLVPVLEKLKTISKTPEFQANNQKSVVLTFDFANESALNGSADSYFSGIEIPALTTQPILWGPHLNLLPDINKKENIHRLNTFLYYQNISKDKLKTSLSRRVLWAILGYLGPEKTSDIYSGKSAPITQEEIDATVDNYEKFIQNFNFQNAQNPGISFILASKTVSNDFSNLDRWYERDAGEVVGDYILYRVKLRQP